MRLFKHREKELDNFSLKHGVGLITHDNPTSVVSEQFNTVRTNIQFSLVDKELNSILFTSSAPSQGKSTVSNNVAVTWAKQGEKVVLIDSDLRRPTVHKTFNLDNKVGLSNYLLGNATVDEIIQPTLVDNLFAVTSGPIPPNPSELLGSNRAKKLWKELQDKSDLLILDAPPVNAVTDSQVLATQVDGVIMVVPQGIAEKSGVIHAKHALENVHANILGVIMNRMTKEKSVGYYGGSYGGYYGMEKDS